jgi:transcriptional regulator with XRE-family HTH domain
MPNARRQRPMAAAEVRAALKARGLRQRDIAAICGVTAAMVSQVVSGKLYSERVWGTILRLLGRSPRKGAK